MGSNHQKKEGSMPRYLFKVDYSVEGLRGVVKEGAASRAAFIDKMASNLGGHLESFDFAFGHPDVYAIVTIPDDTTAAAVAIAIGASGVGSIETVKLITPEEADAALAIETGYRPPSA
jgi:uncharacterized protein with GYD domain